MHFDNLISSLTAGRKGVNCHVTKGVQTWPCSLEIPSSGMGDNLRRARTGLLLLLCGAHLAVYFSPTYNIFSPPPGFTRLSIGGRMRTEHEIPARLQQLIKGRRHKSNLFSNACLWPFHNDEWDGCLIPVNLTALLFGSRCGISLMLITFVLRDSLRCWYDLPFGYCIGARTSLG